MNRKTKLFALVGLLSLSMSFPLLGQGWNPLIPLIELFGEDDNQNFDDEYADLRNRLLDTGSDGLQLSDFDLGPAIDSLEGYLDMRSSIGDADSLAAVWDINRGELDGLLGTGMFSTDDSISLTNRFDQVNGIWYDNYDLINEVSNPTGPTQPFRINFRVFEDGEDRYTSRQGNWERAFNNLQRRVDFFRDGVDPQGVDSLRDVVETTMFNGDLDIEMAFGQEWSTANYYEQAYGVRSSVIRIASVPRHDQTLEYRWALSGSFFTAAENLTSDNGVNLVDGLNPFVCNANFAFLYQPRFGRVGFNRADFRFYTSIGVDLGTYIPSHFDANDPLNDTNVGKTTGYGPEIGAGFIVKFPEVNLYSYATIAQGDIVNGDDYRYRSESINAGVSVREMLNIRYTLGSQRWADGDDKTVLFSRFTIGVILDEFNN